MEKQHTLVSAAGAASGIETISRAGITDTGAGAGVVSETGAVSSTVSGTAATASTETSATGVSLFSTQPKKHTLPSQIYPRHPQP